MSRRTDTRPEVRVGGFLLSSIAPQGWGGLRHQTRINGAWEAAWKIPNVRTWRHPALVAGALVEVMFGPICVFVGTLAEPDWDTGEFIAEGACRDGEEAIAFTGALEASTVPNTVIDAAKTRGIVPWTRVGNFGTTPVGEKDGTGGLVTLRSVLDAWAQENNSNWAIENVPARNLIIRPTSEAVVHWYVTPDSGVLGSAEEKRVDRLALRYISSTTGRRATFYYAPAGGRSEKPVDVTDRGAMTAAKASSIAQSMWNDLKGRPGFANGLALKRGQVTSPGGPVADLAFPKGGETMRLLGVPDARGLARHTDVVIADTDYDWEADDLQVNFVGTAARDEESVLEEVGNLAFDAMAKASSKSSLSFSDYIRTGTVLCSPPSANTFIAGSITFDKPLPKPPHVEFTPFATSGTIDVYLTARDETGFDFVFRRDTATATNVDWIATCLPG